MWSWTDKSVEMQSKYDLINEKNILFGADSSYK